VTVNCDSADCEEVLAAAYAFLDGEADEATCAKVRAHIEACDPCLHEVGLERKLKEAIARSCGCDEAPAELRAKVVTRIAQVRIEIERVDRVVE
jgi:mycothiol system anti-sigma-R factor